MARSSPSGHLTFTHVRTHCNTAAVPCWCRRGSGHASPRRGRGGASLPAGQQLGCSRFAVVGGAGAASGEQRLLPVPEARVALAVWTLTVARPVSEQPER